MNFNDGISARAEADYLREPEYNEHVADLDEIAVELLLFNIGQMQIYLNELEKNLLAHQPKKNTELMRDLEEIDSDIYELQYYLTNDDKFTEEKLEKVQADIDDGKIRFKDLRKWGAD